MKKSSNTPTPHDATFKQFLANPDTAKDFMQLHLPGELRELCDLTTLKLESGSFIEDDLRAYFSDVLYSVKTRVGEGYIHVLIEHQSSADKHMAFRLMRYAIAAMQKHLDAKHKTLPLVIPILFYTGSPSPYPYSTNWLEGFDRPDVAERLYGNPFPLVDVTVIPDDEIMEHRSMAALTLLQKHIRQRDLAELMDRLVTLLLAGYMTRQQTISLVNYMVEAGDALDVEAFVRELAYRVPQHEEELMTIAQRLEQKGIEKGIQKGIEKGIQEGIEKGIEKGIKKGMELGKRSERLAILKIVSTMRQNGMDDAAVMKMTGLTAEELAQLHQ